MSSNNQLLFTITTDAEAEKRRLKAINSLEAAGCVFRNRQGEAVDFNDLDFDYQVAILNSYTYPMDDVLETWMEAIVKNDSSKMNSDLTKEKVEVDRLQGVWRRMMGREVLALTAETPKRKRKFGEMEVDQLTGKDRDAAALEEGRNGNEGKVFFRMPYEIVAFDDEVRPIARRQMPSIERTWHPSKLRRGAMIVTGADPSTPWAMQFNGELQAQYRGIWRTEIFGRPSNGTL